MTRINGKLDISLNMFHHFSNNSQLYLQCLSEGEYRIDNQPAHCSLMKYFKLEEDHVIEAKVVLTDVNGLYNICFHRHTISLINLKLQLTCISHK